MAQIEYIKHLYENEGKSLREIAKSVDMSFRTVQKYAYQSNWSLEKLPNTEPEAYPILGPYIPTIDEWLEQDVREPRKQRHSMLQIYKRLKKEKQFTGSYDSVKKYVRKKKYLIKQVREGFLPLAQPQAHAQVDFGDFKYYDGVGVGREGHALVITFPHSNTGWMQVFPSENQECLLTGMKRIFKHIAGVPIKVKCDNMTTAVAQILKGTERILSDGFIRFKLHYRFMAEFCNPDSGHEKGNVENKVGYSRRNMLVPVPVIEDFDRFNKELLWLCDEDHNRSHYKHGILISDLWEQERRQLLTLPEHDYEVFRYEALTVNKYGFVTVDTNKYGLSPELSGKIVQAKIYCNCVELYYDRSLLKTYERSYNKNDEVMDWKQYLPTLSRKPGAAPHTRFYDQLPKLWREHLKSTQGKERKTALMVLSEIISDGNEEFCDEALSLALECGRTDADSIRQCYYMVAKAENHPQPLVLSSSPPVIAYLPNLTAEKTMRTLKLSGLAKDWRTVEYRYGTEQYVRDLMELELREREANRINRMVKTAGFQVIKTLNDFIWKPTIEIPNGITREEMESAAFVPKKENLIFMGAVGTGKTHLATAITLKVCQDGKQTRFFTAASLANILLEKNQRNALNSFVSSLKKVELMVIDEIGFVPLHKEAAELLFQVVSDCYERKSLIITSNLEFSQWNSVFGDNRLTAALIDRLIHHSHIVIFTGDSHRLQESMLRQKVGRKNNA